MWSQGVPKSRPWIMSHSDGCKQTLRANEQTSTTDAPQGGSFRHIHPNIFIRLWPLMSLCCNTGSFFFFTPSAAMSMIVFTVSVLCFYVCVLLPRPWCRARCCRSWRKWSSTSWCQRGETSSGKRGGRGSRWVRWEIYGYVHALAHTHFGSLPHVRL